MNPVRDCYISSRESRNNIMKQEQKISNGVKKIILVITILMLVGLVLIGGGCKKDNLDDSASIETDITNAVNQARETGEIVLTEEIKTPPSWVSFMVSDNICLAVISDEWPASLKREGNEVKIIASGGINFGVVCGNGLDDLKDKIIGYYDLNEISSELLKIEESCKLIEGEKCLLVLIK